ncbi:MAG TPA: CDP-alcohol phosphatidyltransferase family protein [Polyangiales bacterium]|jgi:phosphatidylglycerophosphate synthase|nr:CDP-alcohol phosphatidyltransferase family protein [Polyangiales bacterium]
MTTPAQLPPLASVLKSRDVEDPVNLWFNRPLAYAFVALIYRTSITPNQITLIAMLIGVVSGALWFVGTPSMMLAGGILLWVSAILDGADGILARAKRMFSELGRALDGSSDTVVALATVPAGFYHLWLRSPSTLNLCLMPLALVTAVFHIELYDFYKESFMQRTNPAWDGKPERLAEVEARLPRLIAEKAPWPSLVATHMYIGLVQAQTRIVKRLDPMGAREHLTFQVSDETATSYRRYNLGPMRLWTAISLAPHSYLMAICGMFDRLDIYLWLRAIVANVAFVLAIVWQRRASRRTREDLERMGLPPTPAAPTS